MAVDRGAEAYMNGWFAHKNKTAAEGENPYPENTMPFSRAQWLSGWCDRFSAVKHGGSLELDDVHGY